MDILNQLLADVSDDELSDIPDDTPFADCDGWDSLKHVQLVIGIQSRCNVDLSPDEISRLTCKRAAREILAARGIDA